MVSILQIKCQRLMEGGGSDLICVCSVVSVYEFVGVMGLGRCHSPAWKVTACAPLPTPLPSRCNSKVISFNNHFLNFLAWVGGSFHEETTSSGFQGLPEGQTAWHPHPTEEARSPPAGPRHLLDPSAPLFFHSPHYTAFVTLPGGCRLLESRGHVFHCSGTEVWLLTGIRKCANSIMNFPESGF